MGEAESIEKWYEQTWVIVLFLIFFFPVGLFLMCRYAKCNTIVKTIVTVVIAVLFLFFIFIAFLAFFGLLRFLLAAAEDAQNTMHQNGIEENMDNWSDMNEENMEDNENSSFGYDNDFDDRYDEDNGWETLDQQEIEFDDQEWYVNYEGEEEEGIFIREYLPEGETPEDWNEVITVHFMEGLQEQSLDDIVDQIEDEALQNGIDENDLEIDILEEENDELIYEYFREENDTMLGLHELARMMKADDGVYILQYANGDVRLDSEQEEEWMELIEKAKIAKLVIFKIPLFIEL